MKVLKAVISPVVRFPGLFVIIAVCSVAPALAYSLMYGKPMFTLMAYSLLQGMAVGWAVGAVLMTVGKYKIAKWIGAVVALVFILSAAVDVALIAMTRQPLTPESFALFMETDVREAHGFVWQYTNFKTVVAVLIFLAFIAFVTMIAGKLQPIFEKWIAGLLLVASIGWGVARSAELWSVLRFDNYENYIEWAGYTQSNPVLYRGMQLRFSDPLTKWIWLLKDRRLQLSQFESWNAKQKEAAGVVAVSDTLPDMDILVVVGESFVKGHSSLYGYSRNTNPRLGKMVADGSAFVFDDITSVANFTTASIRNMLSLNSVAEGEKWFESFYFPFIAKLAGMEVYHYDNQTVSRATDGGLSQLFYSPFNMEHTYTAVNGRLFDMDGDFTGYVTDSLQPKETESAKLVIYHLKGQHFPFDKRHTGKSIFGNTPVGHYDTATLYNDSVVAGIFESRPDRPVIAFYFSDHGEDVNDSGVMSARTNPRYGDAAWLDEQFKVPFIVYVNGVFAKRYPSVVEAIKKSTSKRGTLDNIGHTVLRLAGVAAPGIDERDIFSDRYTPQNRVTAGGHPLDASPDYNRRP